MPTRAEVAAYEADGFDTDAWIDQKLKGPAYAERIRRAYMDLLRLEVGTNFQFVQGSTVLRRVKVKDPTGKDTYVYYRGGQRRTRAETDGVFCLTPDETGLQWPSLVEGIPYNGGPKNADATAWSTYTKVLEPWWLAGAGPGFVLADALPKEVDGTPATQIRVCAEEAQDPETAEVTLSPFTATCVSTAPPFARMSCPPKDNFLQAKYRTAFNKDPNAAKTMVSCDTATGFSSSSSCGCGKDLVRCMPGAGPGFDNVGFKFPSRVPIGWDSPFDQVDQTQAGWARMFWGQEFIHFMDDILMSDRSFKEVLTGSQTFVNGPLAQFYRDVAPGQCCGNGMYYGYTAPVALFDATKIPASVTPFDVNTWTKVDNRGDLASGFLTMPVFLTKYGSRRARAHVLWNAFACKDFIAGNLALKPSTEPDLTKRDGCNTCHATLEPLSAYFSRVQESTWNYLPQDKFPTVAGKPFFDGNPDLKGQACIRNFSTPAADGGAPPISGSVCSNYYDPAFTTPVYGDAGIVDGSAILRGAYASTDNADEAKGGPKGFANYLTSTSQFETCVAENVTSAFLGRTLTGDDETLMATLAAVFAKGDFKMSVLVRALVKSDAYKSANNLSSTKWREGGQ